MFVAFTACVALHERVLAHKHTDRMRCLSSAQLLDEGAVQMLRERSDDGNGNPILAAVGTLQFDGGFP